MFNIIRRCCKIRYIYKHLNKSYKINDCVNDCVPYYNLYPMKIM